MDSEQISSNNNYANRKPYIKPQIEKVQLVLEEAVLGSGCKNISLTGLEGLDCIDVLTPCSEPGS